MALISLIDNRRQWLKAEVGFGARGKLLDRSICLTAMLRPGLTVIPDLMDDLCFIANPLVTGEPRLRFYAGAVLRTPEGLPLGALCVLDHVPGVYRGMGRSCGGLSTKFMRWWMPKGGRSGSR